MPCMKSECKEEARLIPYMSLWVLAVENKSMMGFRPLRRNGAEESGLAECKGLAARSTR